ncbi:hypothetical protein [Capnocytophaga leadbetteri]|nr:hypothetical protein [Capnocytophaga leadbetteri]
MSITFGKPRFVEEDELLGSIDRNSLPEDLKFVMEYYEKIRGSL